MKLLLLVSLLQVIQSISGEAHFRRVLLDPSSGCTILDSETLRKFKGFTTRDANELRIKSRPAVHASSTTKIHILDSKQIIEIWGKNLDSVEAHLETLCGHNIQQLATYHHSSPNQNEPEIVKIVNGGDQTNRIDVVFMGDGYTAEERQKFFDDMNRLTVEMFEGVTFKSYLPVFNIWAIYVQSVESGIGYNGAKDTPFRLYREAGQLRGIFPGNAAYARTVCRLTGTSGCDYPSIIGNDDYYGGLGGEFVISTKSNRTGTVVLRHEMGHNFIDVGEEYDNGQVYSGVNAARTLATVAWTHWLSEGTVAREERAIYRLLEYPWADLSRGEQTFTFNSDGQYSRWYLQVSVSAAGEEGSLEFELDGEILPWATRGFDDREFYDWTNEWNNSTGLSAGQHTFTVRSKTPPTNSEIPRMICSVTLHEYGNEEEFHMDGHHVSAYPTWDYIGRKTFRPTNEGCIMRNMTHNEFCPVCREGMWYQFLARVNLIDRIEVGAVPNPDGGKYVILQTLALGPLREDPIPGEELQMRWFLGGVEQVEWRDNFIINAQPGSWEVEITFVTPEVRSDPQGLLSERESFIVPPN